MMMVVLEKEVNPRGWGRWCRLPPVDCFGPTRSAPQVCLGHSHVIIFGVILIHNERGGDFRRGQCDLLLISVSTGRDSLPSEGSLKLLIQIHPNQNEGGVNYTPAHQVITIINDDILEIMILISNQQGDQRPMTFPSKCVGSQISAEPLLWDQPDQLLSQSNTKERAKKSQSKERTVKNSQRKEKIFFGR